MRAWPSLQALQPARGGRYPISGKHSSLCRRHPGLMYVQEEHYLLHRQELEEGILIYAVPHGQADSTTRWKQLEDIGLRRAGEVRAQVVDPESDEGWALDFHSDAQVVCALCVGHDAREVKEYFSHSKGGRVSTMSVSEADEHLRGPK